MFGKLIDWVRGNGQVADRTLSIQQRAVAMAREGGKERREYDGRSMQKEGEEGEEAGGRGGAGETGRKKKKRKEAKIGRAHV